MIPLRGWFIRAARSCTGCVVRYEFFTRYSDLSCCEYDKRTPSKNDTTLSRGIHGRAHHTRHTAPQNGVYESRALLAHWANVHAKHMI